MRTVTDAEHDLQLFWQAFPAEGGAARSTYMFSYADCAKQSEAKTLLAGILLLCVHVTALDTKSKVCAC